MIWRLDIWTQREDQSNPMTFLPIVERELRVTARRGGGPRLATASGAVVVGGIIMLVSQYLLPAGAVAPVEIGRYIFRGLAGLSLIYCLFSGRFSTVDCLSSERREGTLGLLFLTDLKGYDVVFGKLAATSVQAFYGLLAVFPAMAIPLLMGGVTYGEFWRMVLVLVDTFLLSLAIGVFASAFGRDFRQAAALNFLVILLLMALPPASQGMWDIYFSRPVMIHGLFFSCPVYAFALAFDALYQPQHQHFWQSIATIHLLTWVLILWACRRVPRSWQDKAVIPSRGTRRGWGEFRRNCLYGNAATRLAFRKWCLDRNAFYWLAARVWSKPFQAWIFIALAALWWVWGFYNSRGYWLDDTVYFTTAILLNATFKIWITIEAGQRMAEDKKAGAFELLLTTPLSAREIVGGQLLALRRQFFRPLLVVLAVEFLLLFAPSRNTSLSGFDRALFSGAGMLMLPVDLAALVGVVMFIGLTSGNAARSTAKTLSRVLVLPWLGFGLAALACGLWSALAPPPAWEAGKRFNLGVWVVLGILADVVFGLRAWRQLLTRFGQLAEEQRVLSRKEARRLAALDRAALEAARNPRPTPGRRLRIRYRMIIAGLAVIVAGAAAYRHYFRPEPRYQHPPPVIVQLGASNTTIRVAGNGVGVNFVLADGSLWLWGKTDYPNGARIVVPARSGNDNDWTEVEMSYSSALGLKRDGRIWKWGTKEGTQRLQGIDSLSTNPELEKEATSLSTNSARKWVRVSAGFNHYNALMDDGTLCAWGKNSQNELGNGAGPDEVFPVRVGTNRDWVEVRASGGHTLALRADGTLWAWGRIFTFWNRQQRMYSLTTPTRVCAETNWVGFVPGALDLVVNRAGEVWVPFIGPPNPEASADANCQFVYSNYVAGRFASAYCGDSRLYQIRDDGTLWQTTDPVWAGRMGTPGTTTWTRAGKRSDWVAVWSGGVTAFGLTREGTLWTWGVDLGREPAEKSVSRLSELRARLASALSKTPPGMMGWPGGKQVEPSYEAEPWPLMKLVPAR